MGKQGVPDYDTEKTFASVYIPSIVAANERRAKLAELHRRYDAIRDQFARMQHPNETPFFQAVLDIGWLLDDIEGRE